MAGAAVESQVSEGYERLVAAFGEGRLDDYFACFGDEATFIFHGVPWLGSREEYRTEWDRWVKQDGFAVLSVETKVMEVQMLGGAAVLTHSIDTRQRTNAGEETIHERETILFERQPWPGGWWCMSTCRRNRTDRPDPRRIPLDGTRDRRNPPDPEVEGAQGPRPGVEPPVGDRSVR